MNAIGTMPVPVPMSTSVTPPPRLDPFAPDLGGGDDGAPDPALTPADFPFSMMRDAERWVRHHPVASALALLGVGIAVGAAIREFLKPDAPTPEQERLRGILDDLEASIAALREQV
jgi:hypothetical protein